MDNTAGFELYYFETMCKNSTYYNTQYNIIRIIRNTRRFPRYYLSLCYVPSYIPTPADRIFTVPCVLKRALWSIQGTSTDSYVGREKD